MGDQAHLTETCDPDEPQVVTHVETTPATTHDGQMVEAIHADLAHKHLLPGEDSVDTGDVASDLLVSSRTRYGVDLLGPVMPDTSWQSRAATGFEAAAFMVDWSAHTVTCPEGHTSIKWCPTHERERFKLGAGTSGGWLEPGIVSRSSCVRSALMPPPEDVLKAVELRAILG